MGLAVLLHSLNQNIFIAHQLCPDTVLGAGSTAETNKSLRPGEDLPGTTFHLHSCLRRQEEHHLHLQTREPRPREAERPAQTHTAAKGRQGKRPQLPGPLGPASNPQAPGRPRGTTARASAAEVWRVGRGIGLQSRLS